MKFFTKFCFLDGTLRLLLPLSLAFYMKELLEIFAMVAQMANVEVMTPPFQLMQYGIAKPFEGTVYSELSILTEIAWII